MITRRTALQQMVLTSGALALGSTLRAQQQPAAPAQEAEGVFKLPPLGYDYDALEPFIDAETMKLHHTKHHAAYVSRLNQALARVPSMEGRSIEDILADLGSVPADVREDVRNNGGGHANHTLFWESLKKDATKPTGGFANALAEAFGDFDGFEAELTRKALAVFGSGWSWLAWRDGKLVVENSENQDSPLMTGGKPLLGVDVWEHAYYLKYQNRRAEYLKAFLSVINWEAVGARYAALSNA